MQDILGEITATKRLEVESARRVLCEEALHEAALSSPVSTRSMSGALRSSPSGIIAEFKRRSPSKGWIHEDITPGQVVPLYEKGGASAVSILTDSSYFGGNLDYIRQMRPLVDLPILRKDFIISEYQLYEARQVGADAVLLIAACLGIEECHRLCHTAHDLGLEVLLEMHGEGELPYLAVAPDMAGINNRHLGTFHTDVENSVSIARALGEEAQKLCPQMPVFVSESGLSNVETVKMLRGLGYRGFLMGENFMKYGNPGIALSEFIAKLSEP